MSKDKPKGAISRRGFVKTGAAAGLGATAFAGMVGDRPRGDRVPRKSGA